MSSSSEDFFEGFEDDNASLISTSSSILLSTSLSDLSSCLDGNQSDQLLFESLAWDENVVDLFNEFDEITDTREEHNTTTAPNARTEDLHEIDNTDTTAHDDSHDIERKTPSLCLFEEEETTPKRICSREAKERHCFMPASPENVEHCASEPAVSLHNEQSTHIDTHRSSLHRTHSIETLQHTYTVQREQDRDAPQTEDGAEWNILTQYSTDLLCDSKEDSGFEETKSTPEDTLNDDSQLSQRHREIQSKIIDLLHQIERCVTEGIPLPIRRKARWETCAIENGILQTIDPSQDGRTIRPNNVRRLQLMVQLLATIYQLLTTGTSCTKRELYYLHVELAQTPAYAYATLDDICALLDADPWEVNVFNTSKGLIAGSVVLGLNDGQKLDCNSRCGTSVPLDVASVVEIQLTAKLVLVVEKDTVFRRLLEDGILSKFPNTFVLITAKGYPDVSTRLLLKKISDFTSVPIYALMDADPHGIEIFCVYKFGSLAMVHQQQSLAVPTMRWLGLFPSDIELLGLQGVPLRETELKRLEQMIKRPYTEGALQRELLLLRQLATKVEIESLYNIASDFITTVYLKSKLKDCLPSLGEC